MHKKGADATADSNKRIRQAFELKTPGTVPVGICLGGSWPFYIENLTLKDLLEDAKKAAGVFYAVNERVGADFITVGTGATVLMIEALGGEVAFNKKGAPEIVSLLVKEEADLDRFDIQAAVKKPRIQWLKEVAEHTVRINSGKKSIFVSGRAPFTLAGQIFGLENLSKALYRNTDFAHKLLAFTTRLSLAYYEEMLAVDGIDGVFIADPSASGDVISVSHFKTYVLPYFQKVVELARAKNKLTLAHICGNTLDRLHLLPETGLQMISVDAKVDIKAAKELLRGKMGLAGNVDPVMVLEDGSPDTVYEKTQECLDLAAGGGGFMLLPGCDISSKVTEENIRQFVRAAKDWKA